ncbi:cytochrome P450 [Streptomyces sp. NPDC019443]|uniref:cytochrome P450 n=1 Tax=Streptomyces sp. NPDC019443 TaxID=3365061 RepID=UPI0037951FBC
MIPTLDHPLFQLDPEAADPQEEATRMREIGPVVPIALPGGVPCWAITSDALGRDVLRDTATFVKNIAQWGAWQRGELPADWPLIAYVNLPNSMSTIDGDGHRRLRGPLAREFTPARMDRLRPPTQEVTTALLDQLAEAATSDPNGIVDFKAAFALPLPMAVMSEMFGLPTSWHGRLRALYSLLFDDLVASQQVLAASEGIHALFAELLAAKRENPGDDFTSALAIQPDGGDLSDVELVGIMRTLFGSGHETTVHLLISSVRALLAHPDQLARLRTDPRLWPGAIEETLRWDPPVSSAPFRYATKDTEIGGVLVQEGEPVLISYIAMGRDPDRFGPDAHRFDITRTMPSGHTSFGHGTHVCPGAALARLEGQIALPALFARFPDLTLAIPADQLQRLPSVVLNGHRGLPVRLRRTPGS